MEISTNTPTVSFLDNLRGFFRNWSVSIDFAASTNARVAQIDKLNAKSDQELAQMGMRREDIARHVLRDVFYI